MRIHERPRGARKTQGNARVSHLLEYQLNTEDYIEKRTAPSEVSSDIGTEQAERIWQQDLASLVAERDNFLKMSPQTKSFT